MLKCWIYLFLSALCFYFKFEYVSGRCKPGTYGLNCNHACHCDVTNCDDVTGCNGGPSSCNSGWSGQKCTIGNVALGKTTKQSSYFNKEYHNSSLAVDGNLTQGAWGKYCILTNTGQPYTWWQVDLGTEYFIQNITVHFRSDYRPHSIGVKIYTCQSENWTDVCLCYTMKSTDPITKHITCDKTARYVTLYQSTNNRGDTAMDFCEVQVFACDSHFYGSRCTQDCSERHCNGKSTCNSVGKCDNGCTPGYYSTDCKHECSSDQYGLNCSKLCTERKCLGNSTCDPVNGTCVDGCQRGYESTNCTTTCSGTYGYNCNMSCDDRHCKGRQDCDTENGTCKDGCLAGWEQPDCTVSCDGMFGPNCVYNCSSRKCKNTKAPCDHVTGSCEGECLPGWRIDSCTEKCNQGTYGENCLKKCEDRHCLSSENCHHESGLCVGGCLSGWEGETCTQAVTSPGVSKDVIIIAFSVVLVLVVAIFVSVIICLIRRFNQKIKNEMRKSKLNQVRTHENSQHEEEHYDIMEERKEEPGVSTHFSSSHVSRDQLERNMPENVYVNSSQNIEMSEYEEFEWNENSRNTYEKITGK